MTISARLGVAIAAGVPVLVLVSMGPIAALAGGFSVVVWLVSALVGFLMSLIFAELAGSLPRVNGGVAVLAAALLRPRSRTLALIGQWSYWLGWSPALAINSLLVGSYTQQLLLPETPHWVAVLAATLILAGSVAVNHRGMRVGGRMQLTLLACVVTTVVLLFAGALLHRRLDLANISPFAPLGGWGSARGLLNVAGALFIAGWSAYGAELALTYATRYRSGVRDAVKALMRVAAVSVLAFGAVPLLLVAVVGISGVQQDPAAAFSALSRESTESASVLVLGVLTLALLLGLNMIAISSSWTLHQMALSGDAWRFLGRLNRHGMPANALRFDLFVNVGLLLLVTVLSGDDTSEAPIALLAAANVGYFVSMSIALIAARLNHRHAQRHGLLRLRPALINLAVPLAVANLLLLASAGYAWGWRNVVMGIAVLAVAIVLVTRGTDGTALPRPATALPMCWGRAGVSLWSGAAPLPEFWNEGAGNDGERIPADTLPTRTGPGPGGADRQGVAGTDTGGLRPA